MPKAMLAQPLLGMWTDAIRLVYLEAVGPHENVYRDLKRS